MKIEEVHKFDIDDYESMEEEPEPIEEIEEESPPASIKAEEVDAISEEASLPRSVRKSSKADADEDKVIDEIKSRLDSKPASLALAEEEENAVESL